MKQGVSEIVSWVMLIGLSIAIGMLVLQWSKQQTEQTAEKLTQDVTSSLRCGEVSFNVKFVPAASPVCSQVEIANKGLHTIKELQIRGQAGGPRAVLNLPPEQSQTLNIPNFTTSIASPGSSTEFIPLIEGSAGLVPCADRKLSVTC